MVKVPTNNLVAMAEKAEQESAEKTRREAALLALKKADSLTETWNEQSA